MRSLDWSTLVLVIVAAVAVIVVAAAIRGRRSGGTPSCARCGGDARPFAWQDSPTCSCGASLSGRRAIRFPKRRSTILLVTAFSISAFLVAAYLATVHVRERGGGWRGNAPAWLLAALIRAGDNESEAVEALKWKLGAGLTGKEASILGSAATKIDPTYLNSEALLTPYAGVAFPTGDEGAAFLESFVSRRAVTVDEFATSDPEASGVRAFRIRPLPRSGPISFAMRIDRVLVRGEPVGFRNSGGRGLGEWFWCDETQLTGIELDVAAFKAEDLVVEFTLVGQPLAPALAATDSLLRDIDRRSDWGVPYAEASIRRTATATNSGWVRGPPLTVPSWLERFVRIANDQPTDRGAATAPALAAVCNGMIVGGIVVLLTALGRRLFFGGSRLAPATCVACGSYVRGSDATGAATRCPECGIDLSDPRRVQWFSGRRSTGRTVGYITLVVVSVPAATLLASTLQPLLETRITFRLVTPESSAESVVRRALDGATPPIRTQALAQLTSPSSGVDWYSAIATTIFDWMKSGSPLRVPRPWHIERTTRFQLAAVMADAAKRADMIALPFQHELNSFVSTQGGPGGLDVRRCVPVGVPIIPSLNPNIGLSVVGRSLDSDVGDVSFVNVLFLGQFDAPGEVRRSFEWAAGPNLIARRVSFDEPVLRGTMERFVRVLPAEPSGIGLSDAELDPFASQPPVWANVRSLGDRVVVRIARVFIEYGIDIHGEWDVDFGDGRLRRLANTSSTVEWAAVLPRPEVLPDVIKATFVPGDPATWKTRTNPWRWTGSSEIRLLRHGDAPKPGFEHLGVEYRPDWAVLQED